MNRSLLLLLQKGGFISRDIFLIQQIMEKWSMNNNLLTRISSHAAKRFFSKSCWKFFRRFTFFTFINQLPTTFLIWLVKTIKAWHSWEKKSLHVNRFLITTKNFLNFAEVTIKTALFSSLLKGNWKMCKTTFFYDFIRNCLKLAVVSILLIHRNSCHFKK